MEFFSNSKPDLINKKTIRTMEKMLVMVEPIKEPTVIDSFCSFYNNYISPNLFVLILLIIFCLFLTYKYFLKQSKEDELEDFRPAFNPTLPTEEQNSFVHYLPDDIPLNVADRVVIRSEIEPPSLPPAVLPDIPKPWYSREINTGLENSYEYQPDHIIPHPYDWPNNFVSSTSESVDYMTDKNKKNFNDLAQKIFNDQDKMINTKIYANTNYCEYNPSFYQNSIDKPWY
jgi:hypothetical protein